MKIKSKDGEFFFRALIKHNTGLSWRISEEYYQSLEEAQKAFKYNKIMWPVDELAPGCLYVPITEELYEEE